MLRSLICATSLSAIWNAGCLRCLGGYWGIKAQSGLAGIIEVAAFHPLGTARMSRSKRGGVVDPDLETWEIPGLYVVDGSVFPTSLGVNPQLTIMAWATRAAQTLGARVL